LISEVCIDHKVVQSRLGFSPKEVSDALSYPDKDVGGKVMETKMAFDTMLLKFRGIMLVKMDKQSNIPVALEMNECEINPSWFLTGLRSRKKRGRCTSIIDN
ncbi:hypothetical protein MKW92_012031, partial [Papaver armeniacum]